MPKPRSVRPQSIVQTFGAAIQASRLNDEFIRIGGIDESSRLEPATNVWIVQ